MKHQLMTPKQCGCINRLGYECMSCAGGLAICIICRAAECELDKYPTCEEFQASKTLEKEYNRSEL